MDYPLAHAQTKAEIDNFTFPDPYTPGRYRDAEALVKKYHDEYLVFGDIELTVFSLGHQLAGMEKLLVDMMMETEYVIQTEIGLNLIMDPETFRKQLKLFYTEMIQRFKDKELEKDIMDRIRIR